MQDNIESVRKLIAAGNESIPTDLVVGLLASMDELDTRLWNVAVTLTDGAKVIQNALDRHHGLSPKRARELLSLIFSALGTEEDSA